MAQVLLLSSGPRPGHRKLNQVLKDLNLDLVLRDISQHTSQDNEKFLIHIVDHNVVDQMMPDAWTFILEDPKERWHHHDKKRYVDGSPNSILAAIRSRYFGRQPNPSGLGNLMEKITGVSRKKDGHHIIETRVKVRMNNLGLKSFEKYIELLFNHWNSELHYLISQSTTHTTSFFREKDQIWQLARTATAYWRRYKSPYRLWCAGSSTGQEAYSLAYATLSHENRNLHPGDRPITIFGSDICEQSINTATTGIYSSQQVLKDVPYTFIKKLFDAGTGRNQGYFRIKNHIHALCHFKSKNLIDDVPLKEGVHAIFCRNVFIYFTPDIIRKILETFHRSLLPGGRLYLGKTDFVDNYHDLFHYEGGRVFRKLESSHHDMSPTSTMIPTEPSPPIQKKNLELIVIGGSTGGTRALLDIVSRISGTMPPIVVAQHLKKGFFHQFLKSLQGMGSLSYKLAEDGEPLQNNTLYLAPGGFQTRLRKRGKQIIADVDQDNGRYQFSPAVDSLFESAAELAPHFQTCAVLLTGMGRDGANGLLRIKKMGGHTIAQDQKTSAVFGMPKVAIGLGAAREVLPIQAIAGKLKLQES